MNASVARPSRRPRHALAAMLLFSACAPSAATVPAPEPAKAAETPESATDVADASALDGGGTTEEASDGSTLDAPVGSLAVADAHAEQPAMKPGVCQPERWGGWTGSAECRALANRIVPASHKQCTRDSECALVGTACTPHAVSKARAAAYEEVYACGNPRAGQCASSHRAVCAAGCCELTKR